MNNQTINDKSLAIGIPTLNEVENIGHLLKELRENFPKSFIIIVDDNSTDGTQEIINKLLVDDKLIKLITREKKLGIGSAHHEIIKNAKEGNFRYLLTLDADGTHSISDVLKLYHAIENSDLVVGSRYLSKNSLSQWSFLRKFLTHAGHFFTSFFLKIPFDSTGALRIYNLKKLSPEIFSLIRSKGYAFFFESMFVFTINGCRIKEVSVELPARTYGTSKMETKQAIISFLYLLRLYIEARIARDYFIAKKIPEHLLVKNENQSQWNDYWKSDAIYNDLYSAVYPLLSTLYRYYIIRPSLQRVIYKYVEKNSKMLHVGSGSGQVDISLRYNYRITSLDSSYEASNYYFKLNGDYCQVQCKSLFEIDYNEEFDAVYSLGLFEHFSDDEIAEAIIRLKKALKPGGHFITFWPPEFGFSVSFFKLLGLLTFGDSSNRSDKFHPPEISRLKSLEAGRVVFEKHGLSIVHLGFGINDLYTQVQIVAKKEN